MEKKLKLFCLPYAGGSANMYSKWKLGLSENIALCPIELAGRGSRITDSHYQNLEEAVNDIYNYMAEDIAQFDYAIFGHSMGAFLAYELTQKIASMGKRTPLHLFFSGGRPPGMPRRKKLFSSMNPMEFEEGLLALGGTPPEFFKYPELKKIFIPLLRSDFALVDTIVDRPETIPLKTNISVLIGEDEGILPEEARQWQNHTEKECNIHFLKGGHFFVLEQKKMILDIINTSLRQEKMELVA